MTLWIAWSMLASALLACAAATLERAASYLGVPRRFVWIAAMLAATAAPAVLATRRAPADDLPLSSTEAVSPPRSKALVAFSGHRRSEAAMSVLQTQSMTTRQRAGRLERNVGDALAGVPQIVRRADRWLVAAWVLASLAMALGFVRELVRLRRRQSKWSSVRTEFGDVLVAHDVGPAVVGFVHPRVVVSPWTLSADRTTRDLLLRHELEHIRAGDTRLLFVAELALVLVPWNVALWWMTRRLRLAIEIDCDARVVRAIGGARAYGLVLLSVGERYAAGGPLTTSFSGSRLNLEVRIDAMTAPRKRFPLAAALPFVAITVGVLATAAWMPRPTPLVSARAGATAAALPTQARTVDVHSSLTPAPVPPADRNFVADSVVFAPAGAAAEHEPHPLRGNRPPQYPDLPPRGGDADGRVVLGFSVDARGNADSATVHIYEATDSLFTDAVLAVLPSWHFDSAGSVRMAVLFLTTTTAARDDRMAEPAAPAFRAGGKPLTLEPIIVTTRYWSPSVSFQKAYQAQETRVTVSYDNAPIADVLDAFATYSHRKIIASKSVTGTVTAMVRDQPWRYALRALLNANGYDFTVDADSSLVVDSMDAIRRMEELARQRTATTIDPITGLPVLTVRDTTLAGVGYTTRKQSGNGFFIDGNQLDRQAKAFSELVRTLPGFRVAPSGDGRTYVISDAQRTADGCVNFFVDGVLWQTITPGDIDMVQPAQVVAIEAYRSSSTPGQFAPRDQNRCATIVVWTRARVRPDQVRLP